MKRLLAALLAIILAFSMTACGSSSEPAESREPAEKTQQSAEPDNTASKAEASGSGSSPKYSMGETVIVDDENCTFIVTEIDPDGTWGFTVKAFLENKTDKTLMFSWDDVSVMGYMIDPFWAKEIAAGKKANVEIDFSNSELKECGISSVDEITFGLRISDSDDWAADPFVDDMFSIYPTGLTADTVVYDQRQIVDGETVIVDNEYCTFVIESVNEDDIWGYTLRCFIENKADYNMMFSWDDVSVNGFMADPFWASTVAAGKREYTDISFSDSDFEDNGIENVTEIEFTLNATNDDSWSKVFSEVFTFNP